jgi:hypothetical protein
MVSYIILEVRDVLEFSASCPTPFYGSLCQLVPVLGFLAMIIQPKVKELELVLSSFPKRFRVLCVCVKEGLLRNETGRVFIRMRLGGCLSE